MNDQYRGPAQGDWDDEGDESEIITGYDYHEFWPDWVCPEHGTAMENDQPCPQCMETAGDLLADCLPNAGRSLGIPKKMMDESTGPNFGSIPTTE